MEGTKSACSGNPCPHPCPHPCALLPLARKRETQTFCLTPRLSLQLYYIPVLTPEVAGRGGGGHGEGERSSRSRGVG